jgi:peptidoglycan biosynthesis protein MviN/MurJ (putative lipid II flippase)
LIIINIYLLFATKIENYVYSYRKFSSGDYTLLYNILSAYDWSCVRVYLADSAVASLSAALQHAMEQAAFHGIINRKSISHTGIPVP